MKTKKRGELRRKLGYAAAFLAVNLAAVLLLGVREAAFVDNALAEHTQEVQKQFAEVLSDYEHSFRLFARMMQREIERDPDPDALWDYLKSVDAPLLEIEGATFDGLYAYYQGRYLYSWDTPYAQYADTGYVAMERPWYRDAVAGGGEIVFTPPYMSYANHYILTTLSQLQPDGETVFAYDIKMGDIQKLVTALSRYSGEQMMIVDAAGTVLGSTQEAYLGGGLYASAEEAAKAAAQAEEEWAALGASEGGDTAAKAAEKARDAAAFADFRQSFDAGLAKLQNAPGEAAFVTVGGTRYWGRLLQSGDYGFLALVPVWEMMKATAQVWLVPLLVVELLLIYVLGRVAQESKNRELRAAYVELGQTQRRLELALSAAQKAAAIDELTGILNLRSFHREVSEVLEKMGPEERGILVMLDGDHFKQVNDTYGHTVGDEVIKLSAQMIVGRIRTMDLASRLHGDEFAIFVRNTADTAVAQRIIGDINATLDQEARRRKLPPITLSAGAVVARHGDSYAALAKAADAALYRAKETHNGGFASS